MAAPLLTLALAAALAWEPAPVQRVTFVPGNVAAIADLERAFGVTAGSTLSRGEIRRGVQALIASRAVEDAVVTVERREGGVELVVRLQLASRVSGIEVGGVSRRERARVLSDLGLVAGDPLRVAAFEVAVERVRTRLHESGFYAATVDPSLDFDVAAGTVRVTLAIDLGRPLTVRSVAAPGSELSPGELWKRTRLRVGERAGLARLDQGRRTLLESLRRDGFWESEVDPPEVVFTGSDAEVRFKTTLGPCWELDLANVERTKQLEQEALTFLTGDEPFAEAALDLTVARVRGFLQRQGSLLTEVTGEVTDGGACRTLHLRVTHDEKTKIEAVRMPGLTAIDAATVRERIGVRKGHPWWWGREPVDSESLAADAESLLATLREGGYAAAEVGEPRLVPEDGGVAIEFPVTEGERHEVTGISIDGMPEEVAVPALPLEQGGPWSLESELRTREAVLLALQDAGYASAQVSAGHACEAARCAVTLTVTPGAPVRLARLVVVGLSQTRASVVEKVARLETGSPLGPTTQLAVQRRLLGLGIFQRATLRPIPGQDVGANRGWVLDLAEAPTRTFGFGLGWDTVERLRVSASWSNLNMFGRAGVLSFQGRFSDRQRTVEASYREPGRLGLLGFPNWTSVYRTEEHFPSFDLLRRGMWIQIGDLEARPRRMLLRYDYQIVDPDAPDEILSELERDKQRVRLASITPILEWDSRDDIFAPHRGVFASAQLQVAFKAFLGEASFEKLSTSFAAFTPFLGGTLAASARAGVILPRPSVHGECDVEASPSGCDNLAVPIAVRFFGGGRISHRAFATDLLGIPGKTLICPADSPDCPPTELDPVGGAVLSVSSLEWRFPVYGVVGGSMFVDAGNVWASRSDVQLADLRWGAGLGLRVETPVGPIRLEYGWKLDRKPGESRGELFLSLGNPF